MEELAKRAFVPGKKGTAGSKKLQIDEAPPPRRVPEARPLFFFWSTIGFRARVATCCAPASHFAPRPGPGVGIHAGPRLRSERLPQIGPLFFFFAPATVAAWRAKFRAALLLAVPVATAPLAFGLHLLVSQKELPLETRYFSGSPRRPFSAPRCWPRQCGPWGSQPARVGSQLGPHPRRGPSRCSSQSSSARARPR